MRKPSTWKAFVSELTQELYQELPGDIVDAVADYSRRTNLSLEDMRCRSVIAIDSSDVVPTSYRFYAFIENIRTTTVPEVATVELAWFLYSQGRVSRAISVLRNLGEAQRALGEDEFCAETAAFNVGLMLYRLDQYHSALKSLMEASTLGGTETSKSALWVAIGLTELRLGKVKDGQAALKRARNAFMQLGLEYTKEYPDIAHDYLEQVEFIRGIMATPAVVNASLVPGNLGIEELSDTLSR